MASISHVVAAQALELRATEAYVTESGAQAVIVESNLAVPRAELNVYVSGAAGTCTVEGSALLAPVVAGRCEDGIVWLTIYEQWRDYDLTMICDESSAGSFSLPDAEYKHAGADGNGLDFWLYANKPAVREEPFQGAGGSGQHRWVLYADPVLLPLDELNIVRW